ncbi:MAG: hypothetical protein IT518_09845 [Burkholderiales bacterium]|nr:hypothetical protein [Burkholderiales bacterium]
MNLYDELRGEWLLFDVPEGRRPAWTIGRMPDGLRLLRPHARLSVLTIAKLLIGRPGHVLTNATIGYTRSHNAIAQWWAKIATVLVDEGLGDFASAFDLCLDRGDGEICYRPRHGIAFHARK